MNKRLPVILILSALLVGATIVWAAGWYLTKPVPMKFSHTPSEAVNVRFTSESGSEISGWLFAANNPTAIAVLMHGVRSNRVQMMARAQYLLEWNITSLVFDFQAHGESPGNIITLGHLESLDAQAALRYLKFVEPDLPVLTIGVSMGGAAALLAKPALDIDVLVLESVYPDITTAISNRLASRFPGGHLLTPMLSYQIKPRAGISAFELSPVDEAHRVRAATLVLSGSEDVHTTMEDTQKLYKSLPEPKAIRILDGAGHVDLESFSSNEYWSIVRPFLMAHLLDDA